MTNTKDEYPRICKEYAKLKNLKEAFDIKIKSASELVALDLMIDEQEMRLLHAVADETADINPSMRRDIENGMIKGISSSMMEWIEKCFIND